VTTLAVLALMTFAPAADPTYYDDIRPLFRKHCTVCHKERYLKEIEVSGGLALDTYEATLKAKKPVLKVGQSADSPLVQLLVTKDEKLRMPQGAAPLAEAEIALVRKWIDSGAKAGTPPAESTATATTAPVQTRKLDVLLPTAAQMAPGAAGKLDLALKVGPLSPTTAVAFSADGKQLVTGSYGLVTIWDLETGKPLKTITSILGAVNALRFSPDGQTLAVAGGQPSARGEVRLFNVADWKHLATLTGHADVVAGIAFRADGKVLATASFDKTVRTWDLATGKVLQTHTGHSDFVYAVAFSPDGQWLYSASKDRTVKMVDAVTGKSKFTFSGSDTDVTALAVSLDGKQVISSGLDPGLNFWNPADGTRIRRMGGHGVAVHEVAFSKDGKVLASAGGDRTVKFWNPETGVAASTITVGSIVYGLALSPDGKRLAAAGFDGLVRLYDLPAGRLLVTLLSVPPQGEQHDWLALTPEGYAQGSEGLVGLGQWRMGGKPVPGEPVWKTLRQAESVTKAVRGEAVTAPVFGK